jgi:hypothetical protein
MRRSPNRVAQRERLETVRCGPVHAPDITAAVTSAAAIQRIQNKIVMTGF